ncbi:MAG: TRAP transporter small permease subunit [Burkholderiaceae bacterium]
MASPSSPVSSAVTGGGRPIRSFGWIVLAALAAFLINNALSLSLGWPGAAAPWSGQASDVWGWLQLALYPALALLFVWWFVMRQTTISLREDAERIARFNAFIVRAAFWAVLLIGLADAAISFVRVEGMLDGWVGHELATDLGRSAFRGPTVQIPLLVLGVLIALFTRSLGFHWLALLIVAAELMIVITRFVFSYEQAFMGDLVRFWYAALFLFASAYTLYEDGHVRVDVFYANFSPVRRGLVNAFGSLLLGLIFCWVILWVGMGAKTSIINAPIINFEVSQSGFGMYVKYLMAGFLGIFAVTMMIQFVSFLFEAWADYRDDPGRREHGAAGTA